MTEFHAKLFASDAPAQGASGTGLAASLLHTRSDSRRMKQIFPPLHARVAAVTDRIRERSIQPRGAYLEHMAAARAEGTVRSRHGCTNLAHGFAAAGSDKAALDVDPG